MTKQYYRRYCVISSKLRKHPFRYCTSALAASASALATMEETSADSLF